MNRLFGTDGIRGVANQFPLDAETALKSGRAVAAFFEDRKDASGRFLIGRDPRISGDMLVAAMAAGICSMGKDAHLAGILPTPGVAYLTAADGYDAGIVISASHNPFQDNGIKLFDPKGYKLSEASERSIEALILGDDSLVDASKAVRKTGRVHWLDDAALRYRRFLAACHTEDGAALKGMKLVVDCSNGAASRIAPILFEELGAAVTALACTPDGTNINANCGSQHPERLAAAVVAEHAHMGLAFDGDADRLIAVDEKGAVLSGDQVMAICAREMLARGRLANALVVSTVRSNMGFGAALRDMDIGHIKAKVGDRHVMQAMRDNGAVLGGEDSGHMIFLDHHTTGDGMLAALKLIQAVQASGKPLSHLAGIMTVLPQCLINVDVRSKPDLEKVPEIAAAIEEVENELDGRGRVLVRYSGTQPQCRVMVEGPSDAQTRSLCERIAEVVSKKLG